MADPSEALDERSREGGPAIRPARDWARALAPYRRSSTARAAVELAITLLPFVSAWGAMAFAAATGRLWLFALLLIPTAGLVVRLFLIQHDCGHGSFFATRAANDTCGRLLGLLTLTPYDYWRRTHALHHASSGNLAARGIGDVDTLTLREYRARSRWGRLLYRLYRHPAVLFGLGPALLFGLQYRLPLGLAGKLGPWLSTMGTNVGIGLLATLLIWLLGVTMFVAVQVPVMLVAASIGVWLFYVQHQFEETHWSQPPQWNMHEAALHGSSHYDLPPLLRWFTANVGIHHVHHLVSRVPYYRLREVLRDFPELASVGRLTLGQSFTCVGLVLWDEEGGRLIRFNEADARQPTSATERRARGMWRRHNRSSLNAP